jgi:Uma2 family endonuclease
VVGEPATMGRMAGATGFTLAEHYAIGVDTSMRRELIDGALIVSPFASLKHALAASRLHDILSAARPRDLLVLGTINVDREPATNLQPDLTVVSKDALDRPATEIRPLLVVEILSPSTRRFDLTVKRQLYAEFGVASYWIVDIASRWYCARRGLPALPGHLRRCRPDCGLTIVKKRSVR